MEKNIQEINTNSLKNSLFSMGFSIKKPVLETNSQDNFSKELEKVSHEKMPKSEKIASESDQVKQKVKKVNEKKRIETKKEKPEEIDNKNNKVIDASSKNEAKAQQVCENENCKENEKIVASETSSIQDENIEKLSEQNQEVINEEFINFQNLIENLSNIIKENETQVQIPSETVSKLSDFFKDTFNQVMQGGEFNFEQFTKNLKEILGEETFSKLNLENLFTQLEPVVNEILDVLPVLKNLETTNETLEQVVVENKEKTDLNITTKENTKNDLTDVFEMVLNDVLEEENAVKEEASPFLSLYQAMKDEEVGQDNDLINTLFENQPTSNDENIISSFLQNNNKNFEGSEQRFQNSSMMEMTKNFEKVNDILNTLSENNDTEVKLGAMLNTQGDKVKEILKTTEKISSTNIMHRVEDALKEVSRSKDGSTISVRLDPPSLGEVKIDISIKNGTLFARLQAQSEEVRELLKERSADLYQILRESGVDAQEVNVFVSSENYENNKNLTKNTQNKRNDIKISLEEEQESKNVSINTQDSENTTYSYRTNNWIA